MSSQPQQPDANDAGHRSPTVIPQDKTGSAHALAFGLSFPDMIFILAPTIFIFVVSVTILNVSPSRYFLGGLALLAFTLFSIVTLTDWYITPVEFTARGFSYIRERIRMPLVGEAARDVPGIVETHPDADAVEERDSTLVAYVHAYLTNTSLDDKPDLFAEIGRLTRQFNSEIGRAEGSGFDLKMCISQIPGSPEQHIKGLDEAATNPSLPSVGQRYAAEQAAHIVDKLDDKGVMNRRITIAIPVGPDEVNVSNGHLDKLSGSSFIRPSTDQYAAQKSLLNTRVSAVKSAIGSVTNTRQLDIDEIVSLYRQYWLDRDDSLSYTNLATDSLPMADPDLQALMSDASELESGSPNPERADGGTTAVENDNASPGPESADGSERSPDQPALRSESPAENGNGAKRDGNGNGIDVASKVGSVLGSVANASDSARVATSHAAREQAVFAPSYIDAHMKAVELNDQYTSTLWVTGWPIVPQPELLSSILAVPNVRYDMSIYFHSRDYRDKLDEIEDERQTTTAISLEDIGGVDDGDDAEALASDKGQLRDAMRDGDLECFETSVAITIRGDTKEELQWARRKIISRASSRDISVDECHSRQREGLVSTSPSSVDAFEDAVHVDTRFDLTSDSVAHLYPFGGYYRAEADGCTYGIVRTVGSNKDPLGVLQVDRRTLGVSHCCWIGRSGSGKTFDCQSHTFEELLRYPERKAVVVDVKNGGFDGLVKAFDGTKVVVGETTINPFEVRPPSETGGVVTPLKEQIRLLLDMFEIYLMHQGPNEDAETVRSTNSVIIRKLYENFGITTDPETHDPANREKSDRNPVMADYFEMLERAENNLGEFTKIDSDLGKKGLEKDLEILINRLKEFDEQGEYGFLCGESEVDLYDRVVYFDMHEYRKDDSATKGMMLSLITAHAYRMIEQSLVNVVVDEAHDMFADAGRAGKIESMVRQGREAGLMFDFITQSDADFEDGAARVIADQSPIKVWRDLGGGQSENRVSPTDFGLTSSQADLVAGGLASGDNEAIDHSDAVVDIDGDQYFIEKRVSEYAQRLIEYKEVKHGDFDTYMSEHGFGSTDPSASDRHSPYGQDTSDKPNNGPSVEREQLVKEIFNRESSVYGGAPGGKTARVHTGTDGNGAGADTDGASEHPAPSEASAATDVDESDDDTGDANVESDEVVTEGGEEEHREESTQTEDIEQPSEKGLLRRSAAVFTTPITKLGGPVAGDVLAGDDSEPEAELADIPSLSVDEETSLREAGFETPFEVWEADEETLVEIDGISPAYADTISQRAAGVIDPADVPHRSPAQPESEQDRDGNGDSASSVDEIDGQSPADDRTESSDSEGDDREDTIDTAEDSESQDDGQNDEATTTGWLGRTKATIVAPVAALRSSKPEPEPELTDIAPIMQERAAILSEAGYERPLDVWQADQRALSRLDKFDPTLADAVQRYAAELVDRESIPTASSDDESTASEATVGDESAVVIEDELEPDPEPNGGTTAEAPDAETETETATTADSQTDTQATEENADTDTEVDTEADIVAETEAQASEETADEQTDTETPAAEEDATTESQTGPDSPEKHASDDGDSQAASEEGNPTTEQHPSQSSHDDTPDESDLRRIDGIGESREAALLEVGIETPADLAAADISAIAEADGIGPQRAQTYKGNLNARSNGGEAGETDTATDRDESDQSNEASGQEANE